MTSNSDQVQPPKNREPSSDSHNPLRRPAPRVAVPLILALGTLITLAVTTGQPIALIAEGIVAVIGAIATLAAGNARN